MIGVIVHLTAWAPGCADIPRGSSELWHYLGTAAPDEVITVLEQRLDRPANHFALRPEQPRDQVEACVYGRVEDEEKPVLMAVVSGADFEALQSARKSLIEERKAA
ncbi:hypothetical protein [Asticcacaulis solisilvae]|uniref:hypothetical protein n=1 Tax=Asticcacaulis solisilvae TaxID=1217274 RepID=UPI003FD8B11A